MMQFQLGRCGKQPHFSAAVAVRPCNSGGTGGVLAACNVVRAAAALTKVIARRWVGTTAQADAGRLWLFALSKRAMPDALPFAMAAATWVGCNCTGVGGARNSLHGNITVLKQCACDGTS